MADDIDRAQVVVECVRDAGIAKVCANARLLTLPSNVTHCLKCGDLILAARRHAVPAARHCTLCATEGHP